MERFTSAEVDEAKTIAEFIIDLLDNHRETFVFYLADSAVLDWFGRTVRGPKDIGAFLKNNAGTCKHCFGAARPVRSIGFRETHLIKHASEPKRVDRIMLRTIGAGETSPSQLSTSVPIQTCITEIGQGDGNQNTEVLESPMKKCKLDEGQGDTSASSAQVKYLTVEGSIEFRKKSSKKLQGETKWNRPCKLEVGYCGSNSEDCTIYMMIYQGNMRCRRNLLRDFDSCEAD